MFYITSLCSSRKHIGQAVCELAELGFKNIELTAGTDYYASIGEELLDLKIKFGLNFLVHNYFPPQKKDFVLNPATQDNITKALTLNLVKESIGLSCSLQSNLYSMHSGFRNELLASLKEGFFVKKSNSPIEKHSFYSLIEHILKTIVPKGFKIAIENLCPRTSLDKYSFLTDVPDIIDFLSYFRNYPNLGVLLDLAHLDVASKRLGLDLYESLEELMLLFGNRIFELHLSQNKGVIDDHRISTIDSWQLDFLVRHDRVFFDVPIVFEWQNAATKRTYETFLELTNKVIARTAKV